jgi:hypothetical protein
MKKQKSSLPKSIFVAILVCISAILIINYTASFFLDIVFPNSIYVAMKTTRQLVAALKAGDKEKVYELLDDSTQGSQAMNDMGMLAKEEAIINYENLWICDTYIEEEVWDHYGVLYYKDTSVRFKVELVQDVNKSWKAHRFILLPEYGPGGFGDCQ